MQKAQSVAAGDIKRELRPVSRDDARELQVHGGEWAPAKHELLAGKDVDYDGASGPIDFDAAGDPTVGHFVVWKVVETDIGRFEFDLSNRPTFAAE